MSDMTRWGQYMPPSGAQPFSTASANETATPPTSVTETKEAIVTNRAFKISPRFCFGDVYLLAVEFLASPALAVRTEPPWR